MDLEKQKAQARRAVRAAMAELGWNNADLASHADVDPKTVNDFIAGRRWPQSKTLNAVEKALGWGFDAIARGIEEEGSSFGRVLQFPIPDPDDEATLLDRQYGEVVAFTEHVRRTYPDLTSQALDVMLAGTQLYQAARDLYVKTGPAGMDLKLQEFVDRVLAESDGDIDRAVLHPAWGTDLLGSDQKELSWVIDLLRAAKLRAETDDEENVDAAAKKSKVEDWPDYGQTE